MNETQTEHEINFIKRLGSHNMHNENYSGTQNKKELIKGYLKGCEARVRWDKIDKEAVIQYATRFL